MFVGLVSASLVLVPAAVARSEPVRDTRAVLDDSPADSARREAAALGLAPEGERTSASRGNFATVFLSDLGHVLSSPARMNRRAALWTALVAGGAAVLYANDAELYEATQRAQGSALYDALAGDLGDFIEPVGNMGNTNAFYAAGWAAGHAFQVRGLKVIPFQILESHAISGGIRNLAELSVGRSRPSAGRGPRHFESGEGTSFPSGHASVAFELATILSHHARWHPVTVAAYGLATVMAVQRVDSDSHWPSDVFVAAITGHVIARAIVARQDQRERGPRVGLAPWPGGLKVAVAF
jgi:membrane-associated phospholipid phosphatase